MRANKIIALFLIQLIILTPIVFAEETAPDTPPEGAETAPVEPEPALPEINVNIPEFLTQKTITITGSTEPYSTVKLFIDGDINKGGQLNPEFTGAEGNIFFPDKEIGREGTTHSIRLWVQNQEGISNEVEYTVTIDTTKPDLKIDNIPELITEKEFTITGSVNEQSDIEIYIIYDKEDKIAPAKISGIKPEKTEKNLIQFSWAAAKEEDFDKYIVYRDNIPIATIESITYNRFSDPNVNSNTAYSYQIAVMDKAGNPSLKSDILTVTTLEDGFTDRPAPEPIDLTIVIEPVIKINTSDKINVTVVFDEDGKYLIRVEATDKAANKAEITKKTFVDTVPPQITDISPENGAFFYEHYADEVKVTGRTEPNASVYLFVERTPFGYMNNTFEIAGVPEKAGLLEQLEDLREADLKADCRLNIRGKGYCNTNADYDTVADSNGVFNFNKVDLTSTLAAAFRVQKVDPSDLNSIQDISASKNARLLFVASDIAGHKATALSRYRIGTCWSGNLTWDINPLPELQSPTFLSTERLAEGTESIYFWSNLTHARIDSSAVVANVLVTSACDKSMKNEPRFNHSCEILRSCNGRSSKDKKMWYFTCPLGRLEGMDRWLEDDWKGFFKSINNEMSFPFKVRITYREGGQTKTQTTCEEATFVVDNSRINFKEVLPDWMLYDAVDFMGKTSEKIDDAMGYVETALEWTGIGCMASYGLKALTTINRRFVCSMEGWSESIQKIGGKSWSELNRDENPCPATVQERNELTDEQLKARCTKCAGAWSTEAKLYNTYRALCDRVFCHTAPAAWTQNKADAELVTAQTKETEGCGNIDANVRGQSIRKVKCADLKKYRYSEFMKSITVNPFEECFEVNRRIGDDINTYVYRISPTQDSTLNRENIYDLEFYENRKSPGRNVYAVKQNDNNYQTARADTCEEVCNDYKPEKEGVGYWRCIEAEKCEQLNNRKEGEAITAGFINIGLDAKFKYNAQLYGYTQGESAGKKCFPDRLASPANIIQDLSRTNPSTRIECCCFTEGEGKREEYYEATDKKDGGPVFPTDGRIVGLGDKQYPPFSYRYHRIKFQAEDETNLKEIHNQYNPDRYVEGRDKWGCFGQKNAWLKPYDATDGSGKVMHDPFKSHISTFQCLCISGIYNRLQMLQNIIEAMKNCLIEVRETGSADSGVCKEVFSQYVCSMVWRLIQFTRTGCIDGERGTNLQESENQAAATMSRGMDAVWGTVGEMGEELGEEYGNARVSNLLGVGEESVARKICLGAFGYDWEISLREVLDVAYAVPMATLVIAATRSREYLTFNPDSGQSAYEYRASWLINPGCDMENYDVHLSCISSEELYNMPGTKCDDTYGCDCLGLDQEQTEYFYDGRRLASNVLEDRDWHKIVTSPFRYDHLKFILKPDREIKSNLRESCFPEGHEDGIFYYPIRDKSAFDIAACYVDVTSGMFRCPQGASFWGQKGTAYFMTNEINGQLVTNTIESSDPNLVKGIIEVTEGDDITISPKIWKSDGPDVCLRTTITDNAGTEISEYRPIVVEGVYKYPDKVVLEKAMIRGKPSDIVAANGLGIDTKGLEQSFFELRDIFYITFKDVWNKETKEIGTGDDEITISADSQDMIKVDEETKLTKISERWNLDKNGLIVSKRGITAKITSVSLPENTAAEREKGNMKQDSYDKYYIKTEKLSRPRQTKDMVLELVRLKGDKQRYGDANDCNSADIIEYNGVKQQIPYTNRIQVVARVAAPTTSPWDEPEPEYVYVDGGLTNSRGPIAQLMDAGVSLEDAWKYEIEHKGEFRTIREWADLGESTYFASGARMRKRGITSPAAAPAKHPIDEQYNPLDGDIIEIREGLEYWLLGSIEDDKISYASYNLVEGSFNVDLISSITKSSFLKDLKTKAKAKPLAFKEGMGDASGNTTEKFKLHLGAKAWINKEGIVVAAAGAAVPAAPAAQPGEEIQGGLTDPDGPIAQLTVAGVSFEDAWKYEIEHKGEFKTIKEWDKLGESTNFASGARMRKPSTMVPEAPSSAVAGATPLTDAEKYTVLRRMLHQQLQDDTFTLVDMKKYYDDIIDLQRGIIKAIGKFTYLKDVATGTLYRQITSRPKLWMELKYLKVAAIDNPLQPVIPLSELDVYRIPNNQLETIPYVDETGGRMFDSDGNEYPKDGGCYKITRDGVDYYVKFEDTNIVECIPPAALAKKWAVYLYKSIQKPGVKITRTIEASAKPKINVYNHEGTDCGEVLPKRLTIWEEELGRIHYQPSKAEGYFVTWSRCTSKTGPVNPPTADYKYELTLDIDGYGTDDFIRIEEIGANLPLPATGTAPPPPTTFNLDTASLGAYYRVPTNGEFTTNDKWSKTPTFINDNIYMIAEKNVDGSYYVIHCCKTYLKDCDCRYGKTTHDSYILINTNMLAFSNKWSEYYELYPSAHTSDPITQNMIGEPEEFTSGGRFIIDLHTNAPELYTVLYLFDERKLFKKIKYWKIGGESGPALFYKSLGGKDTAGVIIPQSQDNPNMVIDYGFREDNYQGTGVSPSNPTDITTWPQPFKELWGGMYPGAGVSEAQPAGTQNLQSLTPENKYIQKYSGENPTDEWEPSQWSPGDPWPRKTVARVNNLYHGVGYVNDQLYYGYTSSATKAANSDVNEWDMKYILFVGQIQSDIGTLPVPDQTIISNFNVYRPRHPLLLDLSQLSPIKEAPNDKYYLINVDWGVHEGVYYRNKGVLAHDKEQQPDLKFRMFIPDPKQPETVHYYPINFESSNVIGVFTTSGHIDEKTQTLKDIWNQYFLNE